MRKPMAQNGTQEKIEEMRPPDLSTVLKSQYHAALDMLSQAIERCPDDLWTCDDPKHPDQFWHIAYHVLFFTHFYLQPNEEAFQPWEHHRDGYPSLGPTSSPSHREPYTKSQVQAYLRLIDESVDTTVDQLDLAAPECGFWWYKMSKVEHQIVNIRHIQHHTARAMVKCCGWTIAHQAAFLLIPSMNWMPAMTSGMS